MASDTLPGWDLDPAKPVALMGLEWTLVNGRPLHHLVRHVGAFDAARSWLNESVSTAGALSRTALEALAALLAGSTERELGEAAEQVMVRHEAAEVVEALGELGFRTGVASACFHPATEMARRRFGLDFAEGSNLVVDEHGDVTGEVHPPRFQGPCGHLLCKDAVLEDVRRTHQAPFTVAIGAGVDDVCALRSADLGLALEWAGWAAQNAADATVELRGVPEAVHHWLSLQEEEREPDVDRLHRPAR